MGGWNRGLTKETDERVRKNGELIGKSMKNNPKVLKHLKPRFFTSENNPMKGKFKEQNPFYGKHHTEKTKQKLRIIRLGKPMPEKTRIKISQTEKGEGNPNWKGGVSFEPYTPEFNFWLKLQIRTRDNFTCQYCGLKENGKALHIHHIDYDKKNSSFNNLITLCTGCNTKVNNNRVFWTNYFKEVLYVRQ